MNYVLRSRAAGLACSINHSLSSACCFELADHKLLQTSSEKAAEEDLHKLAAIMGFDLVPKSDAMKDAA